MALTREEVLRFAVEVSRDEYVRGQGRLALIETKAQLIALTAGVFITVLVTYGVDKLPLNSPGTGLLAAMTIVSLGVALASSLSASIFAEVAPPPDATKVNAAVEGLLGEYGNTTQPDPKKSEELFGERAAAYARAATNLAEIIDGRIGKLKVAQIALLISLMFVIVWLGLPAIGTSISQFNGGT
jgi:hypothetical protein